MGIALQLLFTGLGVGSIYALVALGFVLIYRATNVVNFAQGDFAMLGAFSMVVLCVDLELPYWLGKARGAAHTLRNGTGNEISSDKSHGDCNGRVLEAMKREINKATHRLKGASLGD